jgi:luciferase family oxidoreductase group 1
MANSCGEASQGFDGAYMATMPQISVLDLSPITLGGDARQALHNSRDLAQHAEKLGYSRFWMAEHHNMPGIASAATAVALAFVAEGTATIRLGAGGVMLPNHAPLAIAEQFGTLAALYPGRIDLGLGRAPGTDQLTAHAMRRTLSGDVDRFPQDVLELMAYFEAEQPGQKIRAVPGVGLKVPLWILGSSLYGAQLAAALGLPFAFASHFAPQMLDQALALYREQFQPSEQLDRPYAMAGVSLVAADSDAEARRLFTSQQQSFVALRTGSPGPLPPPLEDLAAQLQPADRLFVDHSLAHAIVGGPETVKAGLAAFLQRTRADEVIVTSQVYDHAARLRSFELAAQAFRAASGDGRP